MAALLSLYALVDGLAGGTRIDRASYRAVGTVELVADGDIRVHTGSADDIGVERIGRGGLRHPRYAVVRESDRLVVTYRCPSFLTFRCSAALDVTVPARTRLVLRTSNGHVEASGVDGGVDARTVDGTVALHGVAGGIRVMTVDGAIDVSKAGGDVIARSHDGTVTIAGAEDDVQARTANGRVDISGVRGDVDATTVNGAVTVHGPGTPVDLDIHARHSRPTVAAPTDPRAGQHVRITTSHGTVAFRGPR